MLRRDERLKAHLSNDIWEKRDKPPENWSKPLPDWMEERNKNTFLELKATELKENEEKERSKWSELKDNNEVFKSSESSLCSIM